MILNVSCTTRHWIQSFLGSLSIPHVLRLYIFSLGRIRCTFMTGQYHFVSIGRRMAVSWLYYLTLKLCATCLYYSNSQVTCLKVSTLFTFWYFELTVPRRCRTRLAAQVTPRCVAQHTRRSKTTPTTRRTRISVSFASEKNNFHTFNAK